MEMGGNDAYLEPVMGNVCIIDDFFALFDYSSGLC